MINQNKEKIKGVRMTIEEEKKILESLEGTGRSQR